MGKLGKRKRLQERANVENVKLLRGTNGAKSATTTRPDTELDLDENDLEDLIPTPDLVTAIDVLETLAAQPKALRWKALKPLRTALHALQTSQPEAGSLTSRVSTALNDCRWLDARVLLAEMKIRNEVPKLGALQRWVRECDAATVGDEIWSREKDEVFKVLEAILRTTSTTATATIAAQDHERIAIVVKKQVVWEVGDAVGGNIYEEWRNHALFTHEQAVAVKAKFRLLHRTLGAQRKPANLHDALLYTSTPNALPFTFTEPIVKTTHPRLSSVFLLTNVLSASLCRDIITAGSIIGFTPDHPAAGSAKDQTSVLAHNFYWLADTSFVNCLFDRIKDYLPQSYPDGAKLYGINARFRTYRYVPGAVYRPHIDGAWPPSAIDEKGEYVYDASPQGTTVWSRLTFLIYLNDEFEGGETTFFHPADGDGLEAWPVKPRCGGVLVFPHGEGGGGGLLHEGTGVRKGGKFVIRTDVLYQMVKK